MTQPSDEYIMPHFGGTQVVASELIRAVLMGGYCVRADYRTAMQNLHETLARAKDFIATHPGSEKEFSAQCWSDSLRTAHDGMLECVTSK